MSPESSESQLTCAIWTGRFPMSMPFVNYHFRYLEGFYQTLLVAKDGYYNKKSAGDVRLLNCVSRTERFLRIFRGILLVVQHPFRFGRYCSLNEVKYIGMPIDRILGKSDVHLIEFATNVFLPFFLRSIGRLRGKIVVHFHGHDISSKIASDNIYRFRLKRVLGWVDGIIVVSRWQREELIALGADEAKISVIPCGAFISDSLVNQTEKCTFIYAGRLVKSKGVMETLRAYHSCRKRSEELDVDLQIIGDGPEKEALTKYIKDHDLGPYVTLFGKLSHEDVLDRMKQCSVYVQHSRKDEKGWVEGWGISMAEASGMGLPVIATNHGGIIDHQIDGETGYLVEEGNWEAMADRMKELASNKELRTKMGQRGHEYIQKVGNIDTQLEVLKDLIRNTGSL